jgi:hypothetical protein
MSDRYGCITPRIRISEKKLLESLKSLETKTIIQTWKAVTKSTRYRIATLKEIDMGRVLDWYCNKQLVLMKAQIRQMERSPPPLADEYLKLLEALKQHLQEAELQRKPCPTGSVRTTLPVTLRVTPQMREHNIPIPSKKPTKVTPRRGPTPPAFCKTAPAVIFTDSPPKRSERAVRRSSNRTQNDRTEKVKQPSLRILPLPGSVLRQLKPNGDT